MVVALGPAELDFEDLGVVVTLKIGLDLEPGLAVQLLELEQLVAAAADVVDGLIALVVSCVFAADPYDPEDPGLLEPVVVVALPSVVVLPFVGAIAVSSGLNPTFDYLHVVEPYAARQTEKPAVAAAEDAAADSLD